jgi:DNA-binding NarL/FixJ family response regulator
MKTIRVLIADDHTLFRDGLKSLLLSFPDIEVVEETATGRDTIAAAFEQEPDVILMDIQMPDMNGIEVTRRLMQDRPDVGIIMLTMFEDDTSILAAMRAGARGYVLKGADQSAMLRAIRSAANGESLFDPEISRRLSGYFSSMDPSSISTRFADLTERECEVLHMLADGATNEEIAQSLTISLKTVRNHVSNILNKLQVADRTKAAIEAREAGFGSD